MLVNQKVLRTISLSAVCFLSMPVLAHQAGDIIIRAGVAAVSPSESSGIITPTVVSPDGRVSLNNDTQLGLTGTYMLNDNWGLEILAATPFTHTVSFAGDLSSMGSLATAKHLPPTISAQYFFENIGQFVPYIGAGINYTLMLETRATNNGRAVLDVVGTGGDHSIEADDSIGLSLQVGLDYELSDNLLFNASVWYMDIDTTIEVANTLEVDVEIDPWVYMIGIGYKF